MTDDPTPDLQAVQCRHCGSIGILGEDHTCSCPKHDNDCTEHPPATDDERGDVRCSCGRHWLDVTRAEASVIGRKHDDSPGRSHVVSSLLFVGMRRD